MKVQNFVEGLVQNFVESAFSKLNKFIFTINFNAGWKFLIFFSFIYVIFLTLNFGLQKNGT